MATSPSAPATPMTSSTVYRCVSCVWGASGVAGCILSARATSSRSRAFPRTSPPSVVAGRLVKDGIADAEHTDGQPCSFQCQTRDHKAISISRRHCGRLNTFSVNGLAMFFSTDLHTSNKSIIKLRRSMSGVTVKLFPVLTICMRLTPQNSLLPPRTRSEIASLVAYWFRVVLLKLIRSSMRTYGAPEISLVNNSFCRAASSLGKGVAFGTP